MITFKKRRTWGLTISVILGSLFAIVMLAYSVMLNNTAFFSGWVLFTLMIFLTLYNARKKLTYPPLFKSASWMQFHIYAGLLSFLVFFFHTGWRLPTGMFESTLYLMFIVLAGSGFIGLYLTRTVPKSLAHRGNEVIYERIPRFVKELREQAEALVIESVGFNDSTILSDYYSENLAEYMSRPRRFGLHVFMVDRMRNEFQRELGALHRYMNEEERRVATQLSDVLVLKDDLDFHYSRQGMLKGWLFLHVPLTYGLLIFAAAHMVLVHAFYGGLS
ncbi:MAG: hypothetical protein ACI8W1_002713 [Candidatus Azotimanducaceae bacterium]|jgi:hypothetical protein